MPAVSHADCAEVAARFLPIERHEQRCTLITLRRRDEPLRFHFAPTNPSI